YTAADRCARSELRETSVIDGANRSELQAEPPPRRWFLSAANLSRRGFHAPDVVDWTAIHRGRVRANAESWISAEERDRAPCAQVSARTERAAAQPDHGASQGDRGVEARARDIAPQGRSTGKGGLQCGRGEAETGRRRR